MILESRENLRVIQLEDIGSIATVSGPAEELVL